jgi:hypothetical protein
MKKKCIVFKNFFYSYNFVVRKYKDNAFLWCGSYACYISIVGISLIIWQEDKAWWV